MRPRTNPHSPLLTRCVGYRRRCSYIHWHATLDASGYRHIASNAACVLFLGALALAPHLLCNCLHCTVQGGQALTIFTAAQASPLPACPAVNTYLVPSTAVPAALAGVRVVAVRLRPSQARVKDKAQLVQIDAIGLRLK